MFVDRLEELGYLKKLYREGGARLLIVYGRRRIGKTELLRQFSKGKKHIFFSSDLSSEQEQLRQFTEKIYRTTSESFLETQPFTSWEGLLRYTFEHLAERAPLIIIDEFPYLCVSNSALPSILQKIWDEKSKRSNIFLVLCGSYMSFMEREVLGHKSPLFGRRSGQIALQPLEFQDVKGFLRGYSRKQRVYAYATLGGNPAYLQRFSDKRSFEQNVKSEILDKNAFLYAEPRFLLMEELREPSTYFSILRAIASGRTKLNEIVQATGIESRHKVNKYLAVLRELCVITREVPVTEEKPHKSRKGIYVLEDPFFRFWFRYVFPNISFLEEGDVDYVWEEKIGPDLDSFVGYVFEDLCVERLKKVNSEDRLPFRARNIARWWTGKTEVDIVALDGKGSFMFCECKWTAKKIGVGILDELQRKSEEFRKVKRGYFGLFSRSGFTKDLVSLSKKREDILLFPFNW